MQDLIVVGAGPAGLMTAYEAAKKGRQVVVLEARDRIGGRLYTRDGIEHGAEFIHGELPLTLSLIKEAGLSHTPVSGEWVQLRSGDTDEVIFNTSWPELMQKLASLEEDVNLQDFLDKHFADNKYARLRDMAMSFAEGYDTADASKASALALAEEWSHMDEDDQSRIDGGYVRLISYLADRIVALGGELRLSTPVSGIQRTGSNVRVVSGERSFEGQQLVLAVPLGVLQSGTINIEGTDLADYRQAIRSLGFGDVIKFILRFRKPFWEASFPDMGFLLSAAAVPTWWTQLPARSTVLTGWLGGRGATSHKNMSEAQLLAIALASLAQIFSQEPSYIEALLQEAHIANWSSDPYTLGSYAYTTVGYKDCIQTLSQPIEGRIFFAGEYMYSGADMGTVEAALWSGKDVAARL